MHKPCCNYNNTSAPPDTDTQQHALTTGAARLDHSTLLTAADVAAPPKRDATRQSPTSTNPNHVVPLLTPDVHIPPQRTTQ